MDKIIPNQAQGPFRAGQIVTHKVDKDGLNQPLRESHIERELKNLENEVSALAAIEEQLETRLMPITDTGQVGIEKDSMPEEILVPLADRIRRIRHDVIRTNARLMGLNQSIEL
jgi:sensor domain CHASE-containing protein